MEYPTQREFQVERLTVLDLDRHIFNTELFHAYIREAAWEKAGINSWELDDVKEQQEAAGKSLHTDELITAILAARYDQACQAGETPEQNPGEQLMDIFAWVIELCEDPAVRDTLYLPGAKEFIDNLRQSGAVDRGEVMFLTWGTTPLQILKLVSSGLNDIPYIVTDEGAKGQYLANSQNEDGDFVLTSMNGTTITARWVDLFDDKASSFKGLPEGARGYWKLQAGQDLLESQKGEVPPNVERIYEFPTVNLGQLALRNSQ